MKSKVSILGVKSILLVCGVLMYFTAIIIPRGFTNPAVYQNSVGTKIPATTKGTISNPLYLLFWGEPGSPPIHPGTSFDLTMVTELAPGDNERGTFWLPLNSWPGITDSTEEDIWKIEKFASIPIKERPIDVLYRSSNCDPSRERAVSKIRHSVESQGYRFERDGRCRGGKPLWSRRYNSPIGRDPGFESKTMIAMSRIQDWGHEALDEKLSLPMKYGSIPLYSGTGLRLANHANYPPSSSWLSRSSYETDDGFIEGITELLGNATKMEDMRDKFVNKLPADFNCEEVRGYISLSLPLSLPPVPTFTILPFPFSSFPSPVQTIPSPHPGYSPDYYIRILKCLLPDLRDFTFVPNLRTQSGNKLRAVVEDNRGEGGGGKVNIVIRECCGLAVGLKARYIGDEKDG